MFVVHNTWSINFPLIIIVGIKSALRGRKNFGDCFARQKSRVRAKRLATAMIFGNGALLMSVIASRT